MNRLVIQFDYTDEAADKLISKITDAVSIKGVQYHTDSFTVPKGAVKITEIYPTVNIDRAFKRPINYEMGETKK
jgi:hypothetical protein